MSKDKQLSEASFVAIYTLTDPRTKLVRYVGRTAQPKVRHANHMKSSNPFMRDWIGELADDGRVPIMTVVDIVPLSHAQNAEDEVIATHTAVDNILINTSMGGGGAWPSEVNSRSYAAVEKGLSGEWFILDGRNGETKRYVPKADVVDELNQLRGLRTFKHTRRDIEDFFNEQDEEYKQTILSFIEKIKEIDALYVKNN